MSKLNTFGMVRRTIKKNNGVQNMQTMKKIVLTILKIVKESYRLFMPKIRYKLSLNYEVEVEKNL